MNSKYLVPVLVIAASAALAQTTTQNNTPPAQKSNVHPATQVSQQQPQDEGTRIFQQNCSRCHNAPEGFSPRISGTVAAHMRVRASLSKHDKEVLLRFFNP